MHISLTSDETEVYALQFSLNYSLALLFTIHGFSAIVCIIVVTIITTVIISTTIITMVISSRSRRQLEVKLPHARFPNNGPRTHSTIPC